MVIFLRNRSLVSNTELTNESRVSVEGFVIYAQSNPTTAELFTSLPGNGAWVYVQTGKPSDLFLSQRGGVGLFYAQFLYKDKYLLHRKVFLKSDRSFIVPSVCWSG